MFNCTGRDQSFPNSVVYLSIISCSLSIIGTLIILLTYWLMPQIRNSTRTLVTWLSVADLLTAIGVLISGVQQGNMTSEMCTAQSFITTLSSMVSFFFTVSIAIHIFVTVVSRTAWTSSSKFLFGTVGISWIVPGAITIAATAKNVLGKGEKEPLGTGSWCWVKCENEINVIFWMFISGKAWEILCYLLTTGLYLLLKFIKYLKYRRLGFQEIQSSLRNEDLNFVYVWLVIFGIRIWGTIRFFMYIANKNDVSDSHATASSVFLHMQALGDPAQGFCNFVLFCLFDKTVRGKMFSWCRRRNFKEFKESDSLSGSGTPTRRFKASYDQDHKKYVLNPSIQAYPKYGSQDTSLI